MKKAKTNLIANFAGKSVTAVMGVVFLPIYLRYLGVEAFGLVGFFTSIFLLLYLLDAGISPTLNRETARLTAFPERSQELRDLARTLEVISWAMAGTACLLSIMVSPLIASYWLNPEALDPNTIRTALILMSVTLAFQWAYTFYLGGLQGLQEQALANAITITGVVVRSFGTWLVLAFWSPTIIAFVLCQLVTTALQAGALALAYWSRLPGAERRARFDTAKLRSVWRYAAGLAAIGAGSLTLAQADKVILSRMLPLDEFGYYSLAVMLAGTGLMMLAGSVQTVYFPQYSALVAQGNDAAMLSLYHRSSQVMSFFVLPAVSILAFFSYPIMLVWTRNAVTAENTYLLLSVVAVGTGLNTLTHLPYYAQLAHGITRIGFWQNAIAVVILIPLMVGATINYGALGGAASWALVNLGILIVGVWVMHKYILTGERSRWAIVDVALPAAAAAGSGAVALLTVKSLGVQMDTGVRAAALLGVISIFIYAVTFAAIPATRQHLFERFGLSSAR